MIARFRILTLLFALGPAAPAVAQDSVAVADSARHLGPTPAAMLAIRPGMSRREVEAIVGRPGEPILDRDGKDTGGIRWSFPGADGRPGSLSVGFLDDRATMSMQFGLYPLDHGAPVSREQAFAIQEGMTKEEVDRILGGPGAYGGFQVFDYVTHRYYWRGHRLGSSILIAFREGRVTGPVHGRGGLQ